MYALWPVGCETHAPDAPADCSQADCHLDPGIYEIVWGLWEAGIKTGSSCQGGGPPHASMHRLVRLYEGDGEKALATAKRLGMPVYALATVRQADSPTVWWELWFTHGDWRRSRE